MCSAPLTVSGGVSIEKTSSRGLVRSNLYYTPLFPPARPFLLDAVKRRLARHQAGLPRVRGAGAGIGAHARQDSARQQAAQARSGATRWSVATRLRSMPWPLPRQAPRTQTERVPPI